MKASPVSLAMEELDFDVDPDIVRQREYGLEGDLPNRLMEPHLSE
jgi:hypothetical protein